VHSTLAPLALRTAAGALPRVRAGARLCPPSMPASPPCDADCALLLHRLLRRHALPPLAGRTPAMLARAFAARHQLLAACCCGKPRTVQGQGRASALQQAGEVLWVLRQAARCGQQGTGRRLLAIRQLSRGPHLTARPHMHRLGRWHVTRRERHRRGRRSLAGARAAPCCLFAERATAVWLTWPPAWRYVKRLPGRLHSCA
jgi:hypothetical protein